MAGSIVSKDFKKALVASNFLKFGQFSFNGTPGYRTEAAPLEVLRTQVMEKKRV